MANQILIKRMDAIFLMIFHRYKHVGVSKNRDTPKRMVYNGKPY